MPNGIEIQETNTLGAISMLKFAKISDGLTLVLSATDKLVGDLLLKTYTIIDNFGNNLFAPATAYEFEFIDSLGASFIPYDNHSLIDFAFAINGLSTSQVRYTFSRLIELQEFQIFKRIGTIIGTLEIGDFVKGVVQNTYIEALYLGGDATLLTSFNIKRQIEFFGCGHPVHYSSLHYTNQYST